MKLVKNIADELINENIKIVDNSYILLIGEEFVNIPSVGRNLLIVNRIDYIQFRKWLKTISNLELENFTQEQRDICIEHYVKPTTIELEATGVDDTTLCGYWVEMVKIERMNRYKRMSDAKSKIALTLSVYESFLFYNDTKTFIFDWLEAELPNLELLLKSEDYPDFGIDYTTTGFSSKSYYTEYRKNLILDILYND